MTKREHLIDMLYQHAPSTLDKSWVEEIFKIINKKDWAIFCSQMGDYDHPMERVYAEKECDEALNKLMGNSGTLADCVAHVSRNLKMDIYPASKFYHENFHTLDEEYKE